ncbi:MAG: tRNA (adenosine(37)-N6)-threonylcarbamoyltransferase complex ATPase subunit type 1 TsaE [Thermodesulfobacteriota bacterium]|nr:tRNA (adenosine(37)-N6)-threonylcarbamoyltransferase complex ATPase subunit type 1 TsaE [Thermodesulfobacteriota bacterium]
MQADSRIQTSSVEATRQLGRAIGKAVTPGTVISLTGDLGSGKTAFVQGIARGMGVPSADYVTSPTYTLVNQHAGRHHVLYHIDFYRLEEMEEANALGMDDLLHKEGVVAVEWGDRFGRGLWHENLEIHFVMTGDLTREIRFTSFDEQGKGLIAAVK